MVQEMSDKELITVTIDRYTDLQRIKKANGNNENAEIDYQIKVVTAKLLKGVKSIESSRALHLFDL